MQVISSKHIGKKNSTRFIEKKNPSNVHTFCHREEKTIEHNILGKSDRIQKIRFPIDEKRNFYRRSNNACYRT